VGAEEVVITERAESRLDQGIDITEMVLAPWYKVESRLHETPVQLANVA